MAPSYVYPLVNVRRCACTLLLNYAVGYSPSQHSADADLLVPRYMARRLMALLLLCEMQFFLRSNNRSLRLQVNNMLSALGA